MKVFFPILALTATLFSISGCASPQKPSQFCITLDQSLDFSRCETSEVVCYLTKLNSACYVKPAKPEPEVKKEKK